MGAQPLTNIFFYPLEIIHSKKKATEQKKRVNYYPFGLEHKGYNNIVNPSGNSVAQKFGFGGKELSKERGINWHDFGARNYDASIGRWMNIDPLAEEFYSYSPYNSMMNNPINYIDPTGMAAMWIPKVNAETGGTSYVAEEGDSAKSLSDQYGLDQSKAEAITGTKGSDKIKKGTTISGKTVAKNNNGNNVLKLDVTNKNTTDADKVNQSLFAVRNENVKYNLSIEPDRNGNIFDYFTFKGDKKGSNFSKRVDGVAPMLNRQMITILGDVKLSLTSSIGIYNGAFSAAVARDRPVPIGNGKFQRNLDFNAPSNGKKGFRGMPSRVMTITSRSGNRNTNTLRNYLNGSNKKDNSFYD